MVVVVEHRAQCQRTFHECLFLRFFELFDRVLGAQCRAALTDHRAEYQIHGFARTQITRGARAAALMLVPAALHVGADAGVHAAVGAAHHVQEPIRQLEIPRSGPFHFCFSYLAAVPTTGTFHDSSLPDFCQTRYDSQKRAAVTAAAESRVHLSFFIRPDLKFDFVLLVSDGKVLHHDAL
jgi:hypothetical protein